MEKLDRIIKSTPTLEWNRAMRKFCTISGEFSFFIQHLNELQLINYECCQEIFYHNDQLYFEYEENNLVLSIDIERPSTSCGNINVTKKFSKKTFLVYNSISNNNFRNQKKS
jgi:hypothetical protein